MANYTEWHVQFDVRASVDRRVLTYSADPEDPEDEERAENEAIDNASEAPDEPEQWNDADWQLAFVHPVNPKCDEPGAICWED